MAAAPARGRVWNASAACCPEANRVSSGYSGQAGRCVREWHGWASGGAYVACMAAPLRSPNRVAAAARAPDSCGRLEAKGSQT